MSKAIIINADDIGSHPAIDAAVADLVEIGIVTSASVMALGRIDQDALRTYRRYGIDLGLHLDMTSDMANRRYRTEYNVHKLLLQAWSGRLRYVSARAVVREQLLRFTETTGQWPTFVDGHEHIHQFPIIRDALLDELESTGIRPCLRNTGSQRWRGVKAAVIGALGANAMMRAASSRGHVANTDFFGVYDFRRHDRIAAYWTAWLDGAPERGGLAMCHPSRETLITEPGFRIDEYTFLMSAQFDDLLRQFDTTKAGWTQSAIDAGTERPSFV